MALLGKTGNRDEDNTVVKSMDIGTTLPVSKIIRVLSLVNYMALEMVLPSGPVSFSMKREQ